MLLEQFDFNLPQELIAQFPPENRGDSRMLVMDRMTGASEIRCFSDIPGYLREGDCVVINNTRVINARIFGRKNGDGARMEILFLRRIDDRQWTCFLKPGKRIREGVRIKVQSGSGKEYWLAVTGRSDDGVFTVGSESYSISEIQKHAGHVPLPPYIRRNDGIKDLDRYQTVFAREEGAVAAPTAGLHFTEAIFAKLAVKGVSVAELTLHVGPGTFLPVNCDRIEDHKMHSEYFYLSPDAAGIINSTRKNGGKVLAVGTTSVRVLETCANQDGTVNASSGDTSIFLYPPYRPKVADMLLTNFHLPRSTLLMLVSTFSSIDNVLGAYRKAIENRMMFYSYGDCMLLK